MLPDIHMLNSQPLFPLYICTVEPSTVQSTSSIRFSGQSPGLSVCLMDTLSWSLFLGPFPVPRLWLVETPRGQSLGFFLSPLTFTPLIVRHSHVSLNDTCTRVMVTFLSSLLLSSISISAGGAFRSVIPGSKLRIGLGSSITYIPCK